MHSSNRVMRQETAKAQPSRGSNPALFPSVTTSKVDLKKQKSRSKQRDGSTPRRVNLNNIKPNNNQMNRDTSNRPLKKKRYSSPIDESKFLLANRIYPKNKHGPWCEPHCNHNPGKRDKTPEQPGIKGKDNQKKKKSPKKKTIGSKSIGREVGKKEVDDNIKDYPLAGQERFSSPDNNDNENNFKPTNRSQRVGPNQMKSKNLQGGVIDRPISHDREDYDRQTPQTIERSRGLNQIPPIHSSKSYNIPENRNQYPNVNDDYNSQQLPNNQGFQNQQYPPNIRKGDKTAPTASIVPSNKIYYQEQPQFVEHNPPPSEMYQNQMEPPVNYQFGQPPNNYNNHQPNESQMSRHDSGSLSRRVNGPPRDNFGQFPSYNRYPSNEPRNRTFSPQGSMERRYQTQNYPQDHDRRNQNYHPEDDMRNRNYPPQSQRRNQNDPPGNERYDRNYPNDEGRNMNYPQNNFNNNNYYPQQDPRQNRNYPQDYRDRNDPHEVRGYNNYPQDNNNRVRNDPYDDRRNPGNSNQNDRIPYQNPSDRFPQRNQNQISENSPENFGNSRKFSAPLQVQQPNASDSKSIPNPSSSNRKNSTRLPWNDNKSRQGDGQDTARQNHNNSQFPISGDNSPRNLSQNLNPRKQGNFMDQLNNQREQNNQTEIPNKPSYKDNQPNVKIFENPRNTKLSRDQNSRDFLQPLQQSSSFDPDPSAKDNNQNKLKFGMGKINTTPGIDEFQQIEKDYDEPKNTGYEPYPNIVDDQQFEYVPSKQIKTEIQSRRPSNQRPISVPPEFERGYRKGAEYNTGPMKEMGDITDLGPSINENALANVEQIDQIQDLINQNLSNYGLPECGNLRSTKRKDVRARILAFQALIKEHIRSVEFRQYVKTEKQLGETAKVQALTEKLKKNETTLFTMDNERSHLKNLVNENESEIKNLKQKILQQQKDMEELIADKLKLEKNYQYDIDKVRFQQKTKENQIEIEKKKTLAEIERIKEEMRNMKKEKSIYFYKNNPNKLTEGDDFQQNNIGDRVTDAHRVTNAGFVRYYDVHTQTEQKTEGMSMNISYKLINNYDKSPLDRQFHEMVENGHLKTIKQLREENSKLKDVIQEMSESIRNTIKYCISHVSKLQVLDDYPENIKKLAKIVQQVTPQTNEIRSDMILLDLPSHERTKEYYTMIVGNTRRLKLFLEKIVNPVSICKLIDEYKIMSVEQPIYCQKCQEEERLKNLPAILSQEGETTPYSVDYTDTDQFKTKRPMDSSRDGGIKNIHVVSSKRMTPIPDQSDITPGSSIYNQEILHRNIQKKLGLEKYPHMKFYDQLAIERDTGNRKISFTPSGRNKMQDHDLQMSEETLQRKRNDLKNKFGGVNDDFTRKRALRTINFDKDYQYDNQRARSRRSRQSRSKSVQKQRSKLYCYSDDENSSAQKQTPGNLNYRNSRNQERRSISAPRARQSQSKSLSKKSQKRVAFVTSPMSQSRTSILKNGHRTFSPFQRHNNNSNSRILSNTRQKWSNVKKNQAGYNDGLYLQPFSGGQPTKTQMEESGRTSYLTPGNGIYKNPVDTSASYLYQEPDAFEYAKKRSTSKSNIDNHTYGAAFRTPNLNTITQKQSYPIPNAYTPLPVPQLHLNKVQSQVYSQGQFHTQRPFQVGNQFGVQPAGVGFGGVQVDNQEELFKYGSKKSPKKRQLSSDRAKWGDKNKKQYLHSKLTSEFNMRRGNQKTPM